MKGIVIPPWKLSWGREKPPLTSFGYRNHCGKERELLTRNVGKQPPEAALPREPDDILHPPDQQSAARTQGATRRWRRMPRNAHWGPAPIPEMPAHRTGGWRGFREGDGYTGPGRWLSVGK